jgi:hypothetical protein
MKKINDLLAEKIKNAPDFIYKIVIVTKDGSDINSLNLSNSNELMENIYSSQQSGTKILGLSDLDEIISIEEDEEVGIL